MSRKVEVGKDSSSFFLAGRKLPWWIVGLSLYATNIGAEHLVGLTPPPRPEQLATTTVNWGEKWESFEGITDWRLHLAALSVVTVFCYWLLW